ncbi:hypothetical protein ACVW1A_005429 [Bradyrhizobium sp. LB1.3]
MRNSPKVAPISGKFSEDTRVRPWRRASSSASANDSAPSISATNWSAKVRKSTAAGVLLPRPLPAVFLPDLPAPSPPALGCARHSPPASR